MEEDGVRRVWHRELAAELFNRTWELLEAGRSGAGDREMLISAYASRYHWGVVGTDRNFAIGDWQLSRVWSTLGNAGLAAEYAELSRARAVDAELGPFLEAYGHEGLARAAWLGRDRQSAASHLAVARRLLAGISDDEERETLEADLGDLDRLLGELPT